MVLRDWVWYRLTLKVSKAEYKICYYFIGSSLNFTFCI